MAVFVCFRRHFFQTETSNLSFKFILNLWLLCRLTPWIFIQGKHSTVRLKMRKTHKNVRGLAQPKTSARM